MEKRELKEALHDVEDLEGTPCFHCPEGTMELGTVTRTLEDGDTVLVVKDVPALVCDLCGAPSFPESVSVHLEELMNVAVTADVDSAVQHYTHPKPQAA
jgi:YgiT-type zinc finger domain-containing protein